jgi:hypothetical protein
MPREPIDIHHEALVTNHFGRYRVKAPQKRPAAKFSPAGPDTSHLPAGLPIGNLIHFCPHTHYLLHSPNILTKIHPILRSEIEDSSFPICLELNVHNLHIVGGVQAFFLNQLTSLLEKQGFFLSEGLKGLHLLCFSWSKDLLNGRNGRVAPAGMHLLSRFSYEGKTSDVVPFP